MNEEIQSWNDLADLETYEPENNLLLIDGNNLAYRWIGRNYKDFYDDYVNTIESLAKSYKAERVICCYDFGRSYYRKELYDEYKSNRAKPDDPETAKKFDDFFNCLNEIIDNLPLENYKFRGVEADDLITYFSLNLEEKYDKVWIVSSDKDLYQLLTEKINIFNLYSRREINIDTLLEDTGLTPDENILAMIIRGDRGDNIKGIDGIGNKRSEAIVREFKDFPTLLTALPIKRKSKYIQNLNQGKKILLLNDKLINLKKYHLQAIEAGKDGKENLKILQKVIDNE